MSVPTACLFCGLVSDCFLSFFPFCILFRTTKQGSPCPFHTRLPSSLPPFLNKKEKEQRVLLLLLLGFFFATLKNENFIAFFFFSFLPSITSYCSQFGRSIKITLLSAFSSVFFFFDLVNITVFILDVFFCSCDKTGDTLLSFTCIYIYTYINKGKRQWEKDWLRKQSNIFITYYKNKHAVHNKCVN